MTRGANHVLFKDRKEAGLKLAEKLHAYGGPDTLVIGLARGGVVTAAQIATLLSLPLDVLVIKKISSPSNPEFALGALAPDSIRIVHWVEAQRMGVDEEYVRSIETTLSSEVGQRMHRYRKGKKPLRVEGKTVILVDDGAATGASMEAAVLWARKKRAASIIVALPVTAEEAIRTFTQDVKEVVVLEVRNNLNSVGEYYETFNQLSDEDVIPLLQR